MSSVSETCYMCDEPSTSREHVPPKCLFPTLESIGRDLRKNLITVPSCDKHNSQKSDDDEFFRAILCLCAAGESDVATHHFNDRVLPGARRSPLRYLEFAPRAHAAIATPAGKSIIKADTDRFDRCIEHIAKALCFHTFGIKWRLPMVISSPNLVSRPSARGREISAAFQSAVQATRFFGSRACARRESRNI